MAQRQWAAGRFLQCLKQTGIVTSICKASTPAAAQLQQLCAAQWLDGLRDSVCFSMLSVDKAVLCRHAGWLPYCTSKPASRASWLRSFTISQNFSTTYGPTDRSACAGRA